MIYTVGVRPYHNMMYKRQQMPAISACCIDAKEVCPQVSNGKLSQDYSPNFFLKYRERPLCSNPSLELKPDNELC